MKIIPTQARIVQTIHPLVVIKTRSERKETIKAKTRTSCQNKCRRTMILTKNEKKRSVGL
jgi:hypothetical protein